MLSVGIQTQWGTKGDVKDGLELTPMDSFDVGQGGASTPDLIVTEFQMGCRQTWLQLVCCTP